jgi:hypothetical protein
MFQDWFASVPELITATDETDILTTDLYDRTPTQPWSKQNITLLGVDCRAVLAVRQNG